MKDRVLNVVMKRQKGWCALRTCGEGQGEGSGTGFCLEGQSRKWDNPDRSVREPHLHTQVFPIQGLKLYQENLREWKSETT